MMHFHIYHGSPYQFIKSGRMKGLIGWGYVKQPLVELHYNRQNAPAVYPNEE
jgi:hypothetical protein